MSHPDFEQLLMNQFEDVNDREHFQNFVVQLWQLLMDTLQFPAIVGISGAQGSGKTTLASLLVQYGREQGIAVGCVSLDDYYLSQQQRAVLADQVHPLMQMRGMPGSHQIGHAIADAKKVLQGEFVALPRFDKALDQPVASHASKQFDLLIVEGWCLGLPAQHADELELAVNSLELLEDHALNWRHFVNQKLAQDYQHYWSLCRPLIWLKAPDWPAICRWRELQEQQLRQRTGQGMQNAELNRFMQSFQRLTQHSFNVLPKLADIVVELDQRHRPFLTKT